MNFCTDEELRGALWERAGGRESALHAALFDALAARSAAQSRHRAASSLTS